MSGNWSIEVVEGEEGTESALSRGGEKEEVPETVSQCPCDLLDSGSGEHLCREGLVVSMSKRVIGEPAEEHKSVASKK